MNDICRHCGSSDVIPDDGVDVCRSCVADLTLFAIDPERATDAMLGSLIEKHAGTVRLVGEPLRWERIRSTPARQYDPHDR